MRSCSAAWRPGPAAAAAFALGGLALSCLSVPPPPGGVIDECGAGNGFVEVVTGHDHSCGRTADGQVYCWGSNDSGQLGNGSSLASGTPARIASNLDAVMLAAGRAHTCAVDASGQAWCWGANRNSELGRGDRGASGPAPAIVRAIGSEDGGAPLDRVEQIAAGDAATCALRESSEVWCWGRNNAGEAGSDTDDGRIALATPVEGLPGVVGLAMGGGVGCAWTEQGALYCWGSNGQSQLGEEVTDDFSAIPVEIAQAGAVETVALSQHTCVATSSGEISCWGNSDDGVLGLEVDDSSVPSAVTVVLPDEPEIVDLSAGPTTSCAVTAEGALYCWGRDEEGELGAERRGVHVTPVEVELPRSAVAVEAGRVHTCAVLGGGGVLCWGSDRVGQLGRAPELIALTPQQVDVPFAAAQVAAGDAHTCALDGDGRTYCWGRGREGQLGDRSEDASAPREVTGIEKVLRLAVGDAHTCALVEGSEGGEVWCWGEGGDGQTTGEPGSASSPQRVELDGPADALSVHDDQTCASVGGQAVCWGQGNDGLVTAGVDGVALVAAGVDHACASDGELVACWGDGGDGELGQGEREPASADEPVFAALPGEIDEILAIAAGDSHTLALADGVVYGWGRAGQGQLGEGTDGRETTPVKVLGAPEADALTTTDAASCARSNDGELWCWGENPGGRLGADSSAARQREPARVTGLSDVTSFSLGAAHGCATTAAGELWCWGSDADGRRGHGRALSSAEPVGPARCE